jgi:hypothetical protein
MTNTKPPRLILRHAIVALLLGQTSASSAVRASRKNPWRELEIPVGGIVVYTQDEVLEEKSTMSAPTNYEKRIDLVIAVGIPVDESSETAADDAVDLLARQVEVLIERSTDFGLGTNEDAAAIGMQLKRCAPKGTETDLNEAGRKPTSFAILKYHVHVMDRMIDANDDTLLPLEQVQVNYDLANAQARADQAQDVVPVET